MSNKIGSPRSQDIDLPFKGIGMKCGAWSPAANDNYAPGVLGWCQQGIKRLKGAGTTIGDDGWASAPVPDYDPKMTAAMIETKKPNMGILKWPKCILGKGSPGGSFSPDMNYKEFKTALDKCVATTPNYTVTGKNQLPPHLKTARVNADSYISPGCSCFVEPAKGGDLVPVDVTFNKGTDRLRMFKGVPGEGGTWGRALR